MKMLILLATTVLATLAQATPLVGDYSNFKATVSTEGQTMAGTLEVALVAKTATGFKMTATTKFDNQPSEHQEKDVNADDLINDEMISYLLANCATQNGQLQSVTVPAGTFKTIYLKMKDNANKGAISEVWVNPRDIPLSGMAKTISESPLGKVTIELNSFERK